MTEAQTLTLTDFLLARIAEDEAAATALQRSEWEDGWEGLSEKSWTHFKRFNPARVLAECAVKRRIVEFHQSWPVLVETPIEFAAETSETTVASVAFRASQRIAWLTTQEYRDRFGDEPPTAPMLAALAAVYADHPDYRDEWRP